MKPHVCVQTAGLSTGRTHCSFATACLSAHPFIREFAAALPVLAGGATTGSAAPGRSPGAAVIRLSAWG